MAAGRRLRVEITGAVQGVGFRPHVFRLARTLGLTGWITNDTRGVVVEVEGDDGSLQSFLDALRASPPARAVIREVRASQLPIAGFQAFEIRESDAAGERSALVLPDVATCDACLGEIRDPGDRRYGYAFTNCTDCGPRFTIVQALPYDRANTTMTGFRMCAACTAEYRDPADRRFHAQPNACPACGPRLALWNELGEVIVEDDASALDGAAAALASGRVLAVKGLGGFHLMVDARNDTAVRTLRDRKGRERKPLALMARDVDQLLQLCELSECDVAALRGPDAPIVLLRRRAGAAIAQSVAPGNPYLGVMLPYTPLHHLLLARIAGPVVATSGNRSEEPICIDEGEAVERLRGNADVFLVHDRPIERHADDSIVATIADEPRVLRRARGLAPLPVQLAAPVPPILAVGAHLKNTIALARGREVFLSQHIGDLETPEAQAAFERVITDFIRFYDVSPVALAHDLHPGYASTAWAMRTEHGGAFGGAPLRRVPVQHHHAHLAACLAENGDPGQALGIIWDGTGYGTDGTVWGGEFLLGDAAGYARVAHLRPFRLPGGDAAVREPRRSALALLHEAGETDAAAALFTDTELRVLARMLDTGMHAPTTTSMGRLFDGVAALVGLPARVSYEGEAAMALEFVVDEGETSSYEFALDDEQDRPLVIDWTHALDAIVADRRDGTSAATIAARFHNGLVEAAVAVARYVGQERVALSGGCFQNRLLTDRLERALRATGFDVLLHRQVPPNDGGVSLGQVAVAAATLAAERTRTGR